MSITLLHSIIRESSSNPEVNWRRQQIFSILPSKRTTNIQSDITLSLEISIWRPIKRSKHLPNIRKSYRRMNIISRPTARLPPSKPTLENTNPQSRPTIEPSRSKTKIRISWFKSPSSSQNSEKLRKPSLSLIRFSDFIKMISRLSMLEL